MKKLLLATSILAGTAGLAAAEVTLSGDARMGIIGGTGVDTGFTSRARVSFTMSGSTDSGLEFGASFRADNAVGATTGDAGSVYISGAFGKLSMGDVDGAAQSAVGQVSGVGLTGLGDLNEIVYVAAGSGVTDPTALYEYSTGQVTLYASVTNPVAPGSTNAYAIGAKYATDTFTVAIGHEDVGPLGHTVLGLSGTFGAVTAKFVYGNASAGGPSVDQYAVSVDYAADALTVTGFYAKDFFDFDRYGVGAAYDLGGGATFKAGYAKIDAGGGVSANQWDAGLSFSF